jgi:hypothetical protein
MKLWSRIGWGPILLFISLLVLFIKVWWVFRKIYFYGFTIFYCGIFLLPFFSLFQNLRREQRRSAQLGRDTTHGPVHDSSQALRQSEQQSEAGDQSGRYTVTDQRTDRYIYIKWRIIILFIILRHTGIDTVHIHAIRNFASISTLILLQHNIAYA